MTKTSRTIVALASIVVIASLSACGTTSDNNSIGLKATSDRCEQYNSTKSNVSYDNVNVEGNIKGVIFISNDTDPGNKDDKRLLQCITDNLDISYDKLVSKSYAIQTGEVKDVSDKYEVAYTSSDSGIGYAFVDKKDMTSSSPSDPDINYDQAGNDGGYAETPKDVYADCISTFNQTSTNTFAMIESNTLVYTDDQYSDNATNMMKCILNDSGAKDNVSDKQLADVYAGKTVDVQGNNGMTLEMSLTNDNKSVNFMLTQS